MTPEQYAYFVVLHMTVCQGTCSDRRTCHSVRNLYYHSQSCGDGGALSIARLL